MTTTCLLAWVAIAVTLPLILLFWLTQTPEQRIHRLHRQGTSQRKIAELLCISRYAVRKALR